MTRFLTYINEMAQPSDIHRQTIYYHGTDTAQAAQSIWKNGLDTSQVDIKWTSNSHLKPAPGRVYVTADLRYAIIYALGGDMLSHKAPERWQGNGYVLVFKGSELGDIQPDEDSVGQFISYRMNKNSTYYKENIKNFDRIVNSYVMNKLEDLLHRYYSPSTVRKVRDGEMSWQAKVGKGLMKYLSDKEKHELIDMGAHIANEGKMVPYEMWEIAKQDSVKLLKDGSNFFQVAKKINQR